MVGDGVVGDGVVGAGVVGAVAIDDGVPHVQRRQRDVPAMKAGEGRPENNQAASDTTWDNLLMSRRRPNRSSPTKLQAHIVVVDACVSAVDG